MLNVDNKKEIARHFAATTALEEFWDVSYPIVFMGEWCKRFSRRSYWGSFESTTLPSATQEESICKVASYLQEVYERILLVLAKVLNDSHKVSFSNRYWRIVIGPWLLFYLHILHDKYFQIVILKNKHPDFITTCLDESCFVIPEDTLEFAVLMKGDAYNLQLYSQLFCLFGYKFPTRAAAVEIGPELKMAFYVRQKKTINRLVWLLIDLIDRASLNRKKIIFESTYFQKSALLKLILKMKGRLWPYVSGGEIPLNLPVNHEIRKKIGSIKFGDSEYEKILLPLISMGLPKSMIEGFSSRRANIKRKCQHPPTAIMSAVGWFCNEDFKMFAAESAESGTKLLGVQHGGSYGMLEYFLQEEYELSITDKYFSWGWIRNDCHAKVEPVSATKMVKEKSRNIDRKSKDILYVTDSFGRFVVTYPMSSDYKMNYLDQQSIFLSNLSKGVKDRLVIRPHREDGGMDVNERFRDIIPDVRIETWAQKFSEREYGLLICDNPSSSTTFVESMVNNRPTILFHNPYFAANCFNEKGNDYWKKFKELGIAYDDPLEASKEIDKIYENVDDWWNQPKRQEGVRLFLSEFGRVSDQWDKEWVAVLEKVLL